MIPDCPTGTTAGTPDRKETTAIPQALSNGSQATMERVWNRGDDCVPADADDTAKRAIIQKAKNRRLEICFRCPLMIFPVLPWVFLVFLTNLAIDHDC
jgi:hypothetical protein